MKVQSYVPKSINKCWTHHDVESNTIVKACDVSSINPESGKEERRVVKTSPSSNQQALFDEMFVKKCNPKKDDACQLQIGTGYYKKCDPKKDDKCELDLDKLLFG